MQNSKQTASRINYESDGTKISGPAIEDTFNLIHEHLKIKKESMRLDFVQRMFKLAIGAILIYPLLGNLQVIKKGKAAWQAVMRVVK